MAVSEAQIDDILEMQKAHRQQQPSLPGNSIRCEYRSVTLHQTGARFLPTVAVVSASLHVLSWAERKATNH